MQHFSYLGCPLSNVTKMLRDFSYFWGLLRISKIYFPFRIFIPSYRPERPVGPRAPPGQETGTLKNTYIPGLITNLSRDEKLCFHRCMLPPYWKHLISALDFFTPQRRKEGSSMEKKLIRFRSMTTLLWPISQRVRISPRTSYDQKLAHAE